MSKYFGLKLRTGKTIFCEILDSKEENNIQQFLIKEPLVFEEKRSKDGNFSVAFIPFAVYSTMNVHKIWADEIYMADPLSKRFVKMYGEALMNFEISYAKMDVYELLTGNMNEDYVHLVNMVDKCKKIGEKFIKQFDGLSEPDFSDIEEKLAEHRPSIN